MNRRSFLKNTFWGLAGMGTLSGLYAWQVEPFWLEFVHLAMSVSNLPKELEGKTLMQISDIHIGKRFDHQFVIDSFKKASALNPDFVAYTGDYVTTHKDEVLYPELEAVLDNMVKGKLGTIAILGNHDYGKNWQESNVADKITGKLQHYGATVLRNEAVQIQGLNFIGLDDLWGRNFNPAAAMQHYDASKANIVLCHNPDVCDLDVWNNYEGWILSGHTHGGQCKPPFLPAPILPVQNKMYEAGKYALSNNRTLYINRALGHSWQVRFNVRPEITIFQLQRA